MAPTQFPIETDQPIIEITLPVGTHTLELVVEDSAGLQSELDTVTITVEAAIPKITNIEPEGGLRGATVKGRGTDNQLPVELAIDAECGPISTVGCGTIDVSRRLVGEVTGIDPVSVERLNAAGITNLGQLASMEPASLTATLKISEVRAMGFIDEARRLLKE